MTNKQKVELANWLVVNKSESESYKITKISMYKHCPVLITPRGKLSKVKVEHFINKWSDSIVTKSEPIIIDKTISRRPIDIVIAFDTTGSMSSYITAVRRKVEEFTNTFFSTLPNLQMAICAFGDYCDSITDRFQYTNLTDDKTKIIKAIKEYKNTSGGDNDEFYELVIKNIVEKTTWRKDSKRIFILIGDCKPHEIGYSCEKEVINNQIDWREECQKAANKSIIIDTLNIEDEKWYEEAAEITGGICTPFKNAEKVEHAIKAMIYVDTNKTEFNKQKETAIKSGDKQVIETYRVVEEKRTKTELAGIIEENKGNEVVVCFHKQITKEYLEDIIYSFLNNTYGDYIDIKTDNFDCKKLAKLCLEGELTTMKCKINSLNKLGRYDVLDLLDKKPKQIDPRTIEYVEIKGKRYNKK